MADSAVAAKTGVQDSAESAQPRHSAAVRVTHWVTALCFLALLWSGIEIVISHPRFYWGEDGTVYMPALFTLPIPASRGAVETGYDFVLPDQNGWSRSLHFQSAWLLVFAGAIYGFVGFVKGHFWRELIPRVRDFRWTSLSRTLTNHMFLRRPGPEEAHSYNVLQRLAYLGVVFVLFPMMIWTGLAQSPAVASVFPDVVTVLGGRQSARTLHFLCTGALTLFVVVHIGMVMLAGFRSRVTAMITGKVPEDSL